MTLETPYYYMETPQPGIALCFVHIAAFTRKFQGDPLPSDYRGQKSRPFTDDPFLEGFFKARDFDLINRFKVLKKQVEWMAGKVAVKLLGAQTGLSEASRLRISAEDGGAPVLQDFPGIPVSISHSGDYAVAAMGLDGRNLAVDIEAVELGRMRNIMRVAFSDRERELYQNESDERLYLNWTCKEAFLKYIRKGFAEGLKTVEIIDGEVFHHGRKTRNIIIDSRVVFDTYAFTLMYASE